MKKKVLESQRTETLPGTLGQFKDVKHLCPIGRKDPKKKHYHKDHSTRSFYHCKDFPYTSVSIYFEEIDVEGGKLTYPRGINIFPLGTAKGWEDKSPIDKERARAVGRTVARLLLHSRMLRKTKE